MEEGAFLIKEGSDPLKVRVFIMQLIGWFVFGNLLDSCQPVFV